MNRQLAKNCAIKGEQYRIRGYISHAVTCFNEALDADPTYTWARAHRGASYGVILDLASAEADFKQALKERDGVYPWVNAEWGEALRVYAREHMWRPDEKRQDALFLEDSQELVDRSIAQLRIAVGGLPQSAWPPPSRPT